MGRFSSSPVAVALAVVATAGLTRLTADTISLRPVADTSLFEFAPTNNLGAAANLPAGTIARGTRCRMLLRFELAGILPAGSIITAASLGVTVTSSGGVASVFELRRTLQAWNEGGKGASNNQGDPASPGETTWLARAHPATLWTEPGGLIGSDFAPEAGASLLLSEPGTYTFASTAALVAEAQAWLDHPASNQGWMLMTTEERIANTSKRIAAREAGANAPTLTLEFTPPPLTPPIDRIERVGDQIELRFKIEAGRLYAVEFVEALPSTNWTTLSFAASKFFPTNWVATDSHLNGPQRFYRLAYRGEID